MHLNIVFEQYFFMIHPVHLPHSLYIELETTLERFLILYSFRIYFSYAGRDSFNVMAFPKPQTTIFSYFPMCYHNGSQHMALAHDQLHW